MSTTPEKAAPAIKPEILDLSKRLSAEMKLGKDGVATITEGTYMKLLPSNLSADNVKDVYDFQSQMIAAATHALGHAAIPLMKKHSDLEQAELSLPTVGKDSIDITFNRSRQVPNMGKDGATGTQFAYGTTSAAIRTYGTKDRGELSKIKAELKAEAMKAFGNK